MVVDATGVVEPVDAVELLVVVRDGTVGVLTVLLAPHAAVSTTAEHVTIRHHLCMAETYFEQIGMPRVKGPTCGRHSPCPSPVPSTRSR
ncbi:MAG: hypothetical protein ABSB09_04210 [Acidimicrobiales bacterium]